MPSPSVVKMLRKLIDTLPVGERRFNVERLRPPDKVINNIRELVALRNKIVHSAKYQPPSTLKIEDWLNAARDVLWIVDFYSGHEWASNYISPGVISEMKKKQ